MSRGRRAVVVGGSMAGLCAARVMADHFDQVMVLEKDELPSSPLPHKGVPQGRHTHALLPKGAQVLESWFPGLRAEMLNAGAVEFDAGTGMLQCWRGAVRCRVESTVSLLSASRPFFEYHVARRTADIPNVTVRSNASAEGLWAAPDGTVAGVCLAGGEKVEADLTVDATGRVCRSARWMRDLGLDEPDMSKVDIDLQYATVVIDRGDVFGDTWRAAVIVGAPPRTRMGLAWPLEGGRSIVSLCGFHGDHPPTDANGYIAFARSLPDSFIATALERAGDLGTVLTHRMAANQRRHFEKLRRPPTGLVAVGDAVASFDPAYGQGMSSAALQAQALASSLERHSIRDPRFARSYFRGAAKAVNPLWMASAGGDFANPTTTGARPRGAPVANWLVDRTFRASAIEETVARAQLEVVGLLRPPTALLSPAMVFKILTARSPLSGTEASLTRPANIPAP